jgi:hypothetical protein
MRGEHGERFLQDISTKERRYQGKWSPSMMWMITAGHLDGEFRRQSVAESDPLLLCK